MMKGLVGHVMLRQRKYSRHCPTCAITRPANDKQAADRCVVSLVEDSLSITETIFLPEQVPAAEQIRSDNAGLVPCQ